MVIMRTYFLSHVSKIIDSFSCITLNNAFLYFLQKSLLEVPKYAEMRHDIFTSL